MKVSIGSQEVLSVLEKMPKALAVAIFTAFVRIGVDATEFARDLATYDTGTMKRGIGHEIENGKKLIIGVNSEIDYAPVQEYGFEGNQIVRRNGKTFTRFMKITGANDGKGFMRPTEEKFKGGMAQDIIDEEILDVIENL